ncbi:hypothetical protein CEK28_10225 [Xenophilus sp. AP218F]|nr:hypothetical protein CEK28_10225 [Xenophilus sp. AP218F]
MRQAALPSEQALENNIALWQLLQTVREMEKTMRAETENQPDIAVSKGKTIMNIPLNRILFGPPGTGKTYQTIYAALQILDPAAAESYQQVEDDQDAALGACLAARAALKARFDELSAERRVRFVTFHQSFSYEDFVEGLRAETDDATGQIRYEVVDGVFKQICSDATRTPDSVGLDEFLDQFVEQVAEVPITLKTATGKQFKVSYRLGNATLTCEPLASEKDIRLPANIEQIRKMLRNKPIDKLYCASYVKGISDYLRQQLPSALALPPDTSSAGQPHVLIIDEINRGNISRIFGELITLIEPTKRAGAPEALSVTLPYSKESFSVPDNVYIIGTMNTADRSLAGLDLALRRRFTFTEMPPRPELLDGVAVEGINIGQMLRTMNQRINVLLDRDHAIGHAYFMSLQTEPSLTSLAAIFRQAILPLLQEYFFEDWERIRWVLNDQNKSQADAFIVADESLSLSALFVGVQDSLRQTPSWRLNDAAFERAAAYRGIAVKPGKAALAQTVGGEAEFEA